MTENVGQRKNLSELRKSIQEEYGYTYKDEPLHNDANVAWHFFVEIPQDQLTIEYVAEWIKADEAWLRESSSRELSKDPKGVLAERDFDNWCRVYDAKKGLDGAAPIDKTISFLRSKASDWQKSADENKKRIKEGGPFDMSYGSKSIIRKLEVAGDQVEVWEKISRQLNFAARLVENQPQLTVSEQ